MSGKAVQLQAHGEYNCNIHTDYKHAVNGNVSISGGYCENLCNKGCKSECNQHAGNAEQDALFAFLFHNVAHIIKKQPGEVGGLAAAVRLIPLAGGARAFLKDGDMAVGMFLH